MGPYQEQLALEKMSLLSNGGNPQRFAKEAFEWVKGAIQLFKTAPDNPFGDNDERICQAILYKLNERKSQDNQPIYKAPYSWQHGNQNDGEFVADHGG